MVKRFFLSRLSAPILRTEADALSAFAQDKDKKIFLNS
jgi:hypothetical protein